MKENDLTDTEQRVAHLIIRYLKNHPEAKHTAEGIARWWLLQQKLEEEMEMIKKVINYLTNVGFLEKIILQSGDSYYRIHPERIENNCQISDLNYSFNSIKH